MIVAFIEPEKYEPTAKSRLCIQEIITKLVIKYGAFVFLFSNAGQFDDDCYSIVTKLKKYYPYIERHYYHGSCDYDVGYVDYMSEFYDEVHFPKQGVVLPSHLRFRAMIDVSDVVITCGTMWAVDYANNKKKRVIDICDKHGK